MPKSFIVVGLLVVSALAAACGGATSTETGTASTGSRLTLDVRCTSDAACPAKFECEVEVEHGVSTSFCVAHNPASTSAAGATDPVCPAGFEHESEHAGGPLCKPHDGGADDAKTGTDDSPAATSASGTSAAGVVCAATTDCAPGLECEAELEHGVTTMRCAAHGGGKR